MFKKVKDKVKSIFTNDVTVQPPQYPLNRKQRRTLAAIARKQAGKRRKK